MWNREAEEAGGQLYFEPTYVAALSGFIENPSFETAATLLERLPSPAIWDELFAECGPDGRWTLYKDFGTL